MPRPSRRLWVGVGLLVAVLAIAAWQSTRLAPHREPIYGSADTQRPGSLWTWNGTDYTQLAATGSGPHSSSADMAFDEARNVLVLWDHGCSKVRPGFDGGCQSRVDATWTWDGTRWTERHATSSPREEGPGTMLYDSRLRQVVYVNGIGRAWAWNESAWTPVARGGAPEIASPGTLSKDPLSTFAAGYDEGRAALVLARSDVTWLWDGARWTSAPGGIDYADAGENAKLVYDGAHGQLVYLGKRYTWTWEGSGWQRHDQPRLTSGSLGYDPVRRQVVFVEQDTARCSKTACQTRTWTWNGGSWSTSTVAHPALLPVTRYSSSTPPIAFDHARGTLLLFVSAN
jgi:hypothetical protein